MPTYNPDETWRVICAQAPLLAKLLLPRRYDGNSHYHAPHAASGAFFFTLKESGALDDGPVKPNASLHNEDALTVCALIDQRMPTYFVSPGLVSAALATSFPPQMPTSHIAWPLPAILFILPKGILKLPDGMDVEYLAVAHHAPNLGYSCHPDLPSFSIFSERITWMASAGYSNFSGAFEGGDPIGDDFEPSFLWDGTENPGLSQDDIPRVLDNLGKLALKLVMILSSKKEFLTAERCLRPAKTKHGREREALWSPNIVGSDFRIKVKGSASTDSPAQGGKRLHIVRGHLRDQPYGPRENPRYSSIWIEPYWAGRA